MGCPDGGKGAETTGSFDVADDADDDQGWRFDDCNSFDDLALVHLYKESKEKDC